MATSRGAPHSTVEGQGLGHVLGSHLRLILEIGQGAGHAPNGLGRSRRESGLLDGSAQQAPCLP